QDSKTKHENNAPVIGDHEQHLNALDENPEHIEPENDVQNHDHQPSNEENSERRKNREEAEIAFKAWLEKKKEEQRERLKRLQQQQLMEKDIIHTYFDSDSTIFLSISGNRFPIRSNNNGTHYYGLPPVNNNSHRISPNVSKTTKKRVSRSDSLPSIGGGGGEGVYVIRELTLRNTKY
uniref:Uncharacterized protein n=1 Tax=Romanomermis culicivorax TaxID=13658 RepID=A0A915I1W3_ROMCU